MTICYLLIAVFFLGACTGATIERGEKLPFRDLVSMGFLAALWPFVLAAFAYTAAMEKLK